ncbi:MAG: 50S ribosomal protein L22 [Patescibacteria group bacterium]
MPPIIVKLNYLRIAPRKLRLLADLIRGKSVNSAEYLLKNTVKRGSLPLAKLLQSGLAAAKNNFHQSIEGLFVSKITIDEGPKLKRWRPRARGRGMTIQKKTSHIILTLNERESAAAELTAGTQKPIEKTTRQEGAQKTKKVRPAGSPERQKQTRENRKTRAGGAAMKMFRRKAF